MAESFREWNLDFSVYLFFAAAAGQNLADSEPALVDGEMNVETRESHFINARRLMLITGARILLERLDQASARLGRNPVKQLRRKFDLQGLYTALFGQTVGC